MTSKHYQHYFSLTTQSRLGEKCFRSTALYLLSALWTIGTFCRNIYAKSASANNTIWYLHLAGSLDYIVKPIDLEFIVAALARVTSEEYMASFKRNDVAPLYRVAPSPTDHHPNHHRPLCVLHTQLHHTHPDCDVLLGSRPTRGVQILDRKPSTPSVTIPIKSNYEFWCATYTIWVYLNAMWLGIAARLFCIVHRLLSV